MYRQSIHMHGTKTGAHADPDYEQKYHPGRDGGTSDKKTGFGLSDGKHKIKLRPLSEADPQMGNWGSPASWLEIYINPSESQMKRLSDPEATWDTEMRFMTDKVGNIVVWDARDGFHTQVTDAIFGMPAWAAENANIADIFSDFIIPAGSFYEGIEKLAEDGYWDYPDRIKPKILRRKK
jgi:hypothetical protein